IMDAQRAIECLAAELAAENATDEDIAKLRQIVVESEASLNDAARTTELGAAFHLAVAEASHNRVLVVQLISLQHVSWPRRNPTLAPKVMQRVQDTHREVLALIEARDPAGARRLMDDHVKRIRTRRVSESGKTPLPFVPAKAGTQSQNAQPVGSRLRGNDRSSRLRLKNIDCC